MTTETVRDSARSSAAHPTDSRRSLILAVVGLAHAKSPLCRFFPLGSAFRGGPARLAAEPAIAWVADKHGATPTQIALAWLLARYDRTLLIPGTSSVAHLEENMAAVELELEMADLDVLGRVAPNDES